MTKQEYNKLLEIKKILDKTDIPLLDDNNKVIIGIESLIGLRTKSHSWKDLTKQHNINAKRLYKQYIALKKENDELKIKLDIIENDDDGDDSDTLIQEIKKIKLDTVKPF